MHRRSSPALLLSLLLMFVQQGAVLHELGHLNHTQPAGAMALHVDSHALGSNFCTTCEGFAQVANPAAGAVPTVAVSPSQYLPAPAPRYAANTVSPPTPRSRGPPQA
jgi:hypothetical protein